MGENSHQANAPASVQFAQVAMVVPKGQLHLAMHWYAKIFRFLPAGHTDRYSAEAAHLQSLSGDGARIDMGWMIDRNRLTQLEFFSYGTPESGRRVSVPSWGEIGWHTIGLAVTDYDDAMARIAEDGSGEILTEGESGEDRRALVRDPFGALLEVVDEPEPRDEALRPEVPVAIRKVKASVPDLYATRQFLLTTFGLAAGEKLQADGSAGVATAGEAWAPRLVIDAGPAELEFVQPHRRGKARWREGHQLNDLGIMNIALATQERPVFDEAMARVDDADLYHRDFTLDETFANSYIDDPQEFNFELMYLDDAALAAFGFEPEAGVSDGSQLTSSTDHSS